MTISILNGRKTGFVGEDKIYIGRKYGIIPQSIFHNPYKVGIDGTREQVIIKFRVYLQSQIDSKTELYYELRKLAKKYKRDEKINLTCWCAPKACHGDVLIETIKHFAEIY